jgi:hypothetical protein
MIAGNRRNTVSCVIYRWPSHQVSDTVAQSPLQVKFAGAAIH